MRIICRCGASFMQSGIRNHQQRSNDPRCKETRIVDSDINTMEDLEVDLRGDFFGDYEDYSPEEIGLEPVEDEYEQIPTHNGDSDDDEGAGVNDENHWHVDDEGAYKTPLEPDRLPNPTLPNPDDAEDCDSNVTTQRANRLRGGAEAELNNKPYIVKFKKGKAGKVYTDHDINRTTYISQLGNPENPFSPFSSKIEWEIAHWAKTRGPSSTAFTELMSIDGVRHYYTYHLKLISPAGARAAWPILQEHIRIEQNH